MRAHWTAPLDLALVGSESELCDLRLRVLALAKGEGQEVQVRLASQSDPEPYCRLLSSLRIEVDDGPTLVDVRVGSELHVCGAPQSLAKFASFLDLQPGVHSHYEFYEGHEWIRASSVPLVIECEP